MGIDEEEDMDEKLNLMQMNSVQSKQLQLQRESEALIEKINYTKVSGGFHEGAITAMDICI